MTQPALCRLRSLGCYGLVALFATVVYAQPAPIGPDFQVNAYTTYYQVYPDVAVNATGHFVVVWQSYGSLGDDNHGTSIAGRFFGPNGADLSGEVQINDETINDQRWPAVAGLPGGFLVVWQALLAGTPDTDQTAIHGRRFTADGTPLGPEFLVNSYTTGAQQFPDVDAAGDGSFVVVWRSSSSPGTDSDSSSVLARRFGSDGTPLGPDFQVNDHTPSGQGEAAVTMADNGSFVVTWSSGSSPGDDDIYGSIQARRFDAAGAPSGAQFQVNQQTMIEEWDPDIAVDESGTFLVTWMAYGAPGDEGQSVHGRLFDSSGSPVTPQFAVNSLTTGHQSSPRVAQLRNDNFIVAWTSDVSAGDDADCCSVQFRQLDGNGEFLDTEVQANSYTSGAQRTPAAATDAGGALVMAWNSSHFANPEDPDDSVRVRRFGSLFRDGFESGDTSAWALEAP